MTIMLGHRPLQSIVKPIFHCNAKYLASGFGDARILRWGCQHVGILEPTQTLKFASPPMQNLEFAFPPTRNPNASQWNIGGVGAGIGHVHFRLFVSISFAFGGQLKCSLQWNMGFMVFKTFLYKS